VGFRPQLVVVSGLSVGIPLTVGFRLSLSLWLSQSPFTNFLFSQWIFGYHGAFSRITMEFRFSRSLFTNFSFSRWNLGYQGAFSRTFLFHDGISAIKEPFHELFFFTMESRLSRSLFTNFSFSRWNLGYQGDFSHDEIYKMHKLGVESFHIYHKEYLHRTRLGKNLASWFGDPFARKRVRSFLF
jgi:hypothetical protein